MKLSEIVDRMLSSAEDAVSTRIDGDREAAKGQLASLESFLAEIDLDPPGMWVSLRDAILGDVSVEGVNDAFMKLEVEFTKLGDDATRLGW